MKKNKGSSSVNRRQEGFTLIEVLVAIAIVGILSSIVYVSLTSTRNRSADSAIKTNLSSIIGVSAIIYSQKNSYSDFCQNPKVVSFIDQAKSASGITIDTITILDIAGSSTLAVCHYDDSDSWAISVPLKSNPNKSWCVDSKGKLIENEGHLQASVSNCP